VIETTFCRLSTMHESDRQTDKRYSNMCCNRRNRLAVMSPKTERIANDLL